MHPRAIESIGYLSQLILNTSAVPQIIKTYKTKTANDLSWGFFGSLFAGFVLNMTYGVLINHPAIYVGSSISFVLYGSIAYMKYNFARKNDCLPDSQESVPIFASPLSS